MSTCNLQKINFFLQVIFLIKYYLIAIRGEKLLPCTEILQKVCSKTQGYVAETVPEPWPNNINLTLKILDVIGIDEAQQTIKLGIYAFVLWQDGRLDLNRSMDFIER